MLKLSYIIFDCSQADEVICIDSDPDEPSPEALARYLTMRRHTVGIAHQNEALGACCGPNEAAHYQPPGGAAYLHPTMFVPGANAGLLPHVFLPQDLSTVQGPDDETLMQTACISSAIADNNLLRPPQTNGTRSVKFIYIASVATTKITTLQTPFPLSKWGSGLFNSNDIHFFLNVLAILYCLPWESASSSNHRYARQNHHRLC